MDPARVTMRQIAEAAGVTPATVSMALSNHPRISATTRDRIQQLARKMGYAPNPYVSALMRTRRQGRGENERPTLAVINVFPTRDGWSDHLSPTVRQMRLGVIERARERGYRTQDFWLHEPGMTAARLDRILQARGIQGVLLSPFPDHRAVPEFDWSRYSAVAVTVPQAGVTISTVCNDHYFSMLQTMRECHRLGYRRPGLVLGRHLITRFQGRWEAGYYISRELLPDLEPQPPLRIEEREQAADGLEAWLAACRPDVIITTAAEMMLAELRRLGIDVPGQMGLVWTGCPASDHPISGIYQNGFMIGSAALDTVVAMLERHESGLPVHARSYMIEGEWNPGTTLRAPAPAAGAGATLASG